MRLDKIPKGCRLVRMPRPKAEKRRRRLLHADGRCTPLIGAIGGGGEDWEPMKVTHIPVHDPMSAMVVP